MSPVAVRLGTDSPKAVLDELTGERFAERLVAGDAALWGADAESEAAIRLGWVDLAETSRPLLAEIEALHAELRAEGLDRIVLAGMGGSSLAPEVICRSAAAAGTPVDLTVLDTTDPGAVRRAVQDQDVLARTVLVVSSKSGGTVETDSQRRAFLQAFDHADLDGPSRIVVVTDPGSPLAELAERDGYRKVFLADPTVGGRYSALSAFGLVPSGLAGADIAELLDDANEFRPSLGVADGPGMLLGAALGQAHNAGRDKVVLAEHTGSASGTGGAGGTGPIVGFAAWAEQLIAESTGKSGRGLLPVDVGTAGTRASGVPGWTDAGADATAVAVGAPAPDNTPDGVLVTTGPLGALFLLWEQAIAVAGRVIGINPFDQPDVEAAKQQARALLDDPEAGDGLPLAFTEGAVSVYGAPETLRGEPTLSALFADAHLLVPPTGYLALQAYLDPGTDADAAELRELVARRSGVQTTFGWGPRYLHSTGQYHKGGHRNGGFIQITGAVTADLAIPDRPFTFGQLQRAQAAGDAVVLAGTGRPVIRLHLAERRAGLVQLLEAAR